jgi:hypothetical protein
VRLAHLTHRSVCQKLTYTFASHSLCIRCNVCIATETNVYVRSCWRGEGVTNFGAEPVALPPGEVLLSSAPLDDGQVPGDTTVWIRTPGEFGQVRGSIDLEA